MFQNLSDRLSKTIKNLRGQGKISEKNVQDTMKVVRRALLEADVNYKVVKEFLAEVQEASLGDEVLKSITPGQQITKIIHDKLVALLGGESRPVRFAKSGQPTIWMLVGLQGSGKTTTAAKLGLWLKKSGHYPYLIPADIYRPAAIDQLVRVATAAGLKVHQHDGSGRPLEIVKEGLLHARRSGFDTVLVDTAGRLHIDEDLMLLNISFIK